MSTKRRAQAGNSIAQAVGNLQAGKPRLAERSARAALKRAADDFRLHHILGIALGQQEKFRDAIPPLRKALELRGEDPAVLSDLGQCQRRAGRVEEAVATFRRLVAMQPDNVQALNDFGNALGSAGDLEGAAEAYGEALRLQPGFHLVRYNLALLMMKRGEFLAAVDHLRQLVDADAADAEAINNLGVSLMACRRYEEAHHALEEARRLSGAGGMVRENLVRLFTEIGAFDKAFAAIDEATAAEGPRPWSVVSRVKVRSLAGELEREDLVAAVESGVRFDASCGDELAELIALCREACAWDLMPDLEGQLDQLNAAALSEGAEPPERMITALRRHDDPAWQAEMAAAHARRFGEPAATPTIGRVGDRRIRVGYLSADFRNHAVGHLVHALFDAHDADGFEIHALSRGVDDGSVYRRRIVESADAFHDLERVDEAGCAEAVKRLGLDVLVDLNGWTGRVNLGVLARRPAPVSFSMIGYPGTTGGPADYTIVDPVAVPPEQARFFSERLVYVPPFFGMNSAPLPEDRDAALPSRESEGLPENGIVFAAFNKTDKLDEATVGIWLDVLERVPGSVLWLAGGTAAARDALHQVTEGRGVDGDRLVFAGITSKATHLKRLELADLALDTTIYNGGATTADLLWAGVPVVAQLGRSFAARVSASQLEAVGLRRELCVSNTEEYRELAVRLAEDGTRRQALRTKVLTPAARECLFSAERSARRFEAAYRAALEDAARGGADRPLDPFGVLAGDVDWSRPESEALAP